MEIDSSSGTGYNAKDTSKCEIWISDSSLVPSCREIKLGLLSVPSCIVEGKALRYRRRAFSLVDIRAENE